MSAERKITTLKLKGKGGVKKIEEPAIDNHAEAEVA